MADRVRFDYSLHGWPGEAGLMPHLPLTLGYRSQKVEVEALLDTGAAVNVLPFGVGLQLGAVWDAALPVVRLGGNLGQFEARALILTGEVGTFPQTRLAFAWTQADDVPVILGQVNFFLEFNACFHRAERYFEVWQRHT